MTQKEREEHAWLAGIIDGEGCISISHYWHKIKQYDKYDLKLLISMTHKATIQRVKSIAGVGVIYPIPPSGKKKRMQYRWVAYGHQAASVLRLCLPFMTTKKEEAILALEFSEQAKIYGYTRKGKPKSDIKYKRFEAIRDVLHSSKQETELG